MLLAEDLLLLVTDDDSGRLSVPGVQADAGLGGANLVELTLLGKVDVAGEQDPGKPGRIIVRDPSPPGDEVLDAALQTRQLVTQALVQPSAPDERTAALIALLHALKCEHKVVDPRPYQLSRRQLRARAAEVAQGNWASEAVRKAIDEMMAAVAAASAAATAATSG
jgi:Golgi phosphoprotein 3 (GPP34)